MLKQVQRGSTVIQSTGVKKVEKSKQHIINRYDDVVYAWNRCFNLRQEICKYFLQTYNTDLMSGTIYRITAIPVVITTTLQFLLIAQLTKSVTHTPITNPENHVT